MDFVCPHHFACTFLVKLSTQSNFAGSHLLSNLDVTNRISENNEMMEVKMS
jgi:hypothetical protein